MFQNKVLLYLQVCRIYQWSKNLVVFAGVFFSGQFTDWHVSLTALAAFFLFSFVSSSVYVLNDVVDAERDRKHPAKCKRPIASGRMSRREGIFFSAFLFLSSFSFAWQLETGFALLLLFYFLFNLLYSVFLKKIVLVDVFSLAVCFLLRIFAGTMVVHVSASHWLIACTMVLALFFGFAKRYNECIVLKGEGREHRDVLHDYSPEFLKVLIYISSTLTVVFYTLYTMDAATVAHFQTDLLILTAPVVMYGVFRYLYLVFQRGEGGDPALIFLKDAPLFISSQCWLLLLGFILYG